jgi:hypothetical protein
LFFFLAANELPSLSADLLLEDNWLEGNQNLPLSREKKPYTQTAAGFEDATESQIHFAHFSVFTGGVRICPDVHAFGTLMLLGWEAWFLVLVMAAQWHEKPHTYSQVRHPGLWSHVAR